MSASGGSTGQQGTPVANNATGAATPAVATLPAVAGKTNYVTGFEITATGSTAAAVVQAVLAGVIGAPLNYVFGFPAGAALAAAPLLVEFTQPLPASAPNTAVTLTLPSGGAGNVLASVVLRGYVL